jgi:photosystem II stability/assembly factor-like uncharacterized protein
MSVISRSLAIVLITVLAIVPVRAAEDDDAGNPLANLPLRPIGPAITSGRISDFAFYPGGDHEFLAGISSGNLFRTTNGGITWEAIFENEGSYAIGVVEIDPNDTKTTWVGTGENNAQRSVAAGDGVYKSTDGGKSWTNTGLRNSGHISQIWINPDDSNEVLVASQGPLWSAGGDRGLYRTLDGGDTWERILSVDEHTGINEFVVDPRNPDIIVASSYQRRRHVWVLINGGPGSGIHKSTDRGKTWTEITAGLPSDHMGRIGLAGAPSDPDMIYAIIEANDEEKGVYRSTDFGSNWEKRSSHMTTSPQYYNEIVVDPQNPERLYSLDTFTMKSEDGGTTFAPLSNQWRHVDDHALWIDPDNTDHLYIGGDGGIYETWDLGTTWRHVRNLSITQFYRVQPDYVEPFYNVCGGTQDNNSLCAPSRTTTVHGITNSDWNLILGGDGYEPQFDPTDPNIVYAQYQYGGLARYDRRTQERVYIAPHPESGENAYKWNWNTPLLVSPHDPRRLYYAAEYLFRSDDRGDSWRKVSPDLTRQIDRNKLEVMGRVWGIDTIAKNDSTSIYGSAIMISESELQEGLIYVGTDDGVINVTEDGGQTWRRTTKFPGVPDMTYIDDVQASQHDADVVYAVMENHKRGDQKPYVLKSENRGRTWKSISGDLPERGFAHSIAEDHVDPDLLFLGTEYGVFVTQDGGTSWSQMKNNFPTISVRDIEIQERENDLVVGTFGRGIYILDDYTPLRTAAKDLDDLHLFAPRDPWLYIEGDLWGGQEKGSIGHEFFTAPNPEFGAVLTYYLEDGLKSRKDVRREKEIEIEKEGGDTPYPSWENLRVEDREQDPALFIMIRDAEGRLIRQVAANSGKGLHRTAWDLRLPPPDPVSIAPAEERPYWMSDPAGPLVIPGTYSARLAVQRDGVLTETGASRSFTVKALDASPEIAADRKALQDFQVKVAELQRAVQGSGNALGELQNRLAHVRAALVVTPRASDAERDLLRQLEERLADVRVAIHGDSTIGGRNEPVPMPIASRVSSLYTTLVYSQSPAGGNFRDSYEVAAQEFTVALQALRTLAADVSTLEDALELKGAPWTPGRIPDWSAK